eukprot:TRINITY_DN90636_c0_g1_i1.p1 TRINITY_DN90636_c0_g1~~TRINITY_DN90636_c0_g1_i1.p1  ORF type:complete len:348 (+),score=69.46 TRINITY_DN90636_c0_g1_i1:88-1131(+)
MTGVVQPAPGAEYPGDGLREMITRLSSRLTNVFVCFLIANSLHALTRPEAYAWVTPPLVKQLLALLCCLMGMTASPADFQECLKSPRPILVNFCACFALVPAIAVALSSGFSLPEPFLVGLVLVASVNGGSTSNLFTLIAGADVALSVLMTLTTTLGAVVVMPVVVEFLVGTIVPVDATGILKSAALLVLLPVSSGVCLNAFAPKLTLAVEPLIPIVSMGITLPVSGAMIANSASHIADAGASLHGAVAVLHLLAALSGYTIAGLLGGAEVERRTVAIEVGMKNAVLANLLAALHFDDALIQAPSAVSAMWGLIICAVLSVIWKLNPTQPRRVDKKVDAEWVAGYSN